MQASSQTMHSKIIQIIEEKIYPVSYNNIFVIQTAFLGDVILSTPVVRGLRQIFPDANVDVLTIPVASIVFKHNPYVRQVIEFDKKSPFKKIFLFYRLIKQLRQHHYDLAISIQSSSTSSLLMALGKIPERVGFHFQKMVTIPVSHEKGLHIRDRYLKLLMPFSKEKLDNQTELFWTEKEERHAQQAFDLMPEKSSQAIGIAPGSVWQTKMWLKDYFIELIDRLADKNIAIFLIGGAMDKALCEEIRQKSKNSNVIDVAGELSVLESTALIQKLDLMVTNDSAPLHIANAVKTDVLAIFGPTVRRFGCYPYRERDKMLEIDLYCRPCAKHGGNRCPEKHFRCMREITPEMVYDSLITMIQF